jgi:hypothetical protein
MEQCSIVIETKNACTIKCRKMCERMYHLLVNDRYVGYAYKYKAGSRWYVNCEKYELIRIKPSLEECMDSLKFKVQLRGAL